MVSRRVLGCMFVAGFVLGSPVFSASQVGEGMESEDDVSWLLALTGLDADHLDAQGTLWTATGAETLAVGEMLERLAERAGTKALPDASDIYPPIGHFGDVWLIESSWSSNARCADPEIQEETVHPFIPLHPSLWIYEGYYHSPAVSNVSVEGTGAVFSWTFKTTEDTTGRWVSWIGWSDLYCYQVETGDGLFTLNAPWINGWVRVTEEEPSYPTDS